MTWMTTLTTMNVTINTDASHNSEFNIGAFAFWIASDMGRIMHSGAFKEGINGSHEAETKCIINAFHVLSQSNIAKFAEYNTDGMTIFVNTDSYAAITALGNKKGNRKFPSWAHEYRTVFYEIKKKMKVRRVVFRHVRGHSDGGTPRKWVNNWCDEEAKKHMRLEVQNIQNNKN